MPSLRWSVGLALAVLLALPASAAARSVPCRSDGAPVAGALAAARGAVVCEINLLRRARGLRPLSERPRLRRAGSRYAAAMVAGRFFSHTDPDGATVGDRIRASGYVGSYSGWIAGEALAWGAGERVTPAATVRAWMASPPHRRLLLGRAYRHIGVGVALGAPVAHPPGADATYVAELASRW